MLRIVFTYFWPVLIPIVLYMAWFLWANQQIEEGKDPLKWTDGPWALTIIITLVIALLCFIPIIQSNVKWEGNIYQPAKYENGKLIPGRIDRSY